MVGWGDAHLGSRRDFAGASTMHGYSFKMVVMRFRMILQGAMIDCKRGLLREEGLVSLEGDLSGTGQWTMSQ